MSNSIDSFSFESAKNVAEIAKMVVLRNQLQSKRQQARSKHNYYKNILTNWNADFCSRFIRGLASWRKNKSKTQLLIKVKKYKIEQMKAEVELHELVLQTKKELKKLLKKERAFLTTCCGSNTIISVAFHDYDVPFLKNQLFIEDLHSILVDHEAEIILLGGLDEKVSAISSSTSK